MPVCVSKLSACCVQVSAGLEVKQETQQEVLEELSAAPLSSSPLQLLESDLQDALSALDQHGHTHTPDDDRVHTQMRTHAYFQGSMLYRGLHRQDFYKLYNLCVL